MNLGQALDVARDGAKIRRKGWNNPDAFVVFVAGTYDVKLRAGTPYHSALKPYHDANGDVVANIMPHLDMIYPPNVSRGEAVCFPGWLASQADMLADDWETI